MWGGGAFLEVNVNDDALLIDCNEDMDRALRDDGERLERMEAYTHCSNRLA